jgi:hypothetical protein
MTAMPRINAAVGRMAKGDVRCRFVVDPQTLQRSTENTDLPPACLPANLLLGMRTGNSPP